MKTISFYKKINDIKRAIPVLIKSKPNEYLNTKSIDVNDLVSILEPILMEHKVLAFHYVENGEFTTKIVCEDTGESIKSSIPISNKDPQKIMAEMTYYRRGNYTNLFDLQAHDDDDGNMSSGNAILPDTARKLGKIKNLKQYLDEKNVKTIKQITEAQGQSIIKQYSIDTFDSMETMKKIKSKLDERDLGKVSKALEKIRKMTAHELDKEKKKGLTVYGKYLRGVLDELSSNKS